MKYLNKLNRWIPIIDYHNCYEIITDGINCKVRSLDRLVNGYNGKKLKKGKICKPFLRNGYMSVALSKDGVVKQFNLHRLLGIHYIPNPMNKETINHADTIKINNALSNLEWATMSEQITHALKNGLFKMPQPTKGKFGKDHNRSIPVKQYTLAGELVSEFGSANEAARNTGFYQTSISKACRGELQQHKGFKWSYDSPNTTTNNSNPQ